MQKFDWNSKHIIRSTQPLSEPDETDFIIRQSVNKLLLTCLFPEAILLLNYITNYKDFGAKLNENAQKFGDLII